MNIKFLRNIFRLLGKMFHIYLNIEKIIYSTFVISIFKNESEKRSAWDLNKGFCRNRLKFKKECLDNLRPTPQKAV